jgi:drug/metabolite transporter (DMT)-like permease
VAETVEQLHLLLGVPADLVVGGEVLHELFDASAELVREVRRRRSDERVDVVAGDLGHAGRVSLPSAAVRRLSAAEVGLVVTIVIWSINFTLTKYVLGHGFLPLAYSAVRFTTAALIFCALTLALERSLRMSRRDLLFLFGAAVVGIWLNQLGFVYSLQYTTASTAALVFGTLPIFTMLIARLTGVERLSRRFVAAAGVSFLGVLLVALGAHGEVAGSPKGILLALLGSATWAVYSVAIAPLMRTYSPFRISALGLLMGAALILPTAAPQLADQNWEDLSPLVWTILGISIIGPLVITNILWFTAIDRVGPSRASLYANLQPFLGALFALLLLSEEMTLLQVVGGLAIAAGIVLSRRRPAIPAAE